MFQDVRHCWSCFGPLANVPVVQLAPGASIPCCMSCWSMIDVDRRLELAHKYADLFVHQNQRVATVDALQSIELLFREALEDFQRRTRSEPWEG